MRYSGLARTVSGCLNSAFLDISQHFTGHLFSPWIPSSARGSDGGTHRAAFGGALTARELWLRRIWFLPLFVFMLLYGDARQWPYSLWCFLPEVELGPRGFDLVIGDLPCRVFPVWY